MAQIVSRLTGIPVNELTVEEREKLLHLEQRLHERPVGQDEAVRAVADAVRLSRAGLREAASPWPRSCSWGPPVSARPNSPRRWPNPSTATRAPCCASTCRSTASAIPWRGWWALHRATSAMTKAASSRRRSVASPQRAAARRDREGSPRCLQHPAAGVRRRAAHRRWSRGGLHQHHHHRHLQPGLRHHSAPAEGAERPARSTRRPRQR